MDYAKAGYNRIRYNWTFADEQKLHDKVISQTAEGYPGFTCPSSQMKMMGNPVPERQPGDHEEI